MTYPSLYTFAFQTMQEPLNQPLSSNQTTRLEPQVSPELLLSLAAGPVLVGITLGIRCLDIVQQLGQASEEVFRGDRLPVLKSTPPVSPTSERQI